MKALVSEKSVLFINAEIQFLWKMPPEMILSALLLFSTYQTEKIHSQNVRFMQKFLILPVAAGENDGRFILVLSVNS